MCNKHALPGLILGVLAAIIVVGLGMAPALAYDGNQALPSPNRWGDEPQGFGGSSPLVIPAAAFTSNGEDPVGFYFSFAGGYVDGSGTACLQAPVYLPKGVYVYAIYASLYDNSTGGNVGVNLRRVNRNTGASNEMAYVGTVSNSAAIQQRSTFDISYPHIGDLYSTYTYYATTCLNSADHRLYSVRIYYSDYMIYLPMMLKNF